MRHETCEGGCMLGRLDRLFDGAKPPVLHGTAIAFVSILGWIDYVTGYELSFSLFYLLPIALVAWYSSGPACYVYGMGAAVVWGYSNYLAGEPYSHIGYHFWNPAIRVCFFFITSVLLQKVRMLLDREKDLSRKDHRTGLLNGAGFEETFLQEHSRSVRQSHSMGLIFIDLDKFKFVNDTLGHAEGDKVLVSVAKALCANLRLSDRVGRLGGDEFAVILPETRLEDLESVAAKLVECVSELSRREGWPVTASVGAVHLENPQPADDLKRFLSLCDQLMYRVKHQGRNGHLVESWRGGELSGEKVSKV